MELKLVVVSGKTNKGAVRLSPPIVIGRSRQAQLTVAHPMISRRHCEIFEARGLLMIRDLGSLNGTVVDGRRVMESPLSPGKEFSLGPLTFRAEYESTTEPGPLPSARTVDEDPTRPLVSSDLEMPPRDPEAEEPRPPQTEPPVADPPDFRNWDQTATEAVRQPDRDEIALDIDPATGVGDDYDEVTEPTPPPTSGPSSSTDDPGQTPTNASGENLDDFLKGLR